MLAWILVTVGCAPVPADPTGRPFDAVTEGSNADLAATAEPEAYPGLDPAALAQLPPIPEPPSAEELARANQSVLAPSDLSMAPAPAPPSAISPTAVDLNWDPAMPTQADAFGVTLVGTMTDAVPPNAVLQLPNGEKALVEAGQMLEEQGLLVLAVGDRVVKLVNVTPQGWYAKVETAVIHANPRGHRRPAPAPPTPVPSQPAPPAPAPATSGP